MMAEDLNADGVVQIEAVLREVVAGGYGAERVLKPIREISEAQGWDWFTGGTKADFNRRCLALFQAYSYGNYSDFRKDQLVEGNFAYWIYKADPGCPANHQALNGVAIAPDQAFWQRYYPPLRDGCSCYVVGASSDRMVARLGGEIGKDLPDPLPQVTTSQSVSELLAAIRSEATPVGEAGSTKGNGTMEEFPTALEMARGMSDMLAQKLGDLEATEIVLSREEAAFCRGLIRGMVRHLEHEEQAC